MNCKKALDKQEQGCYNIVKDKGRGQQAPTKKGGKHYEKHYEKIRNRRYHGAAR